MRSQKSAVGSQNRGWLPVAGCRLLVALMVLLAASHWSLATASTYYVDNCVNTGSDSYDGKEQAHTTGTTGPWLTIAHVNAQTFNPGDSVLFQGGCTWREQLTPPSSGSAGSPITFGAYGSGRPILSGDVLASAVPEETGGVFASGFEEETNSFNVQWTGVAASSSNTATITTAAGTTHYGSHAAAVTYAGTTGVTYFYKDITAASSIDIRFYFKLNSLFQLQALGKHATLFTVWDGTASAYPVRAWLYSPSAGVASYVGLAGDFRLNTGSTTSWTGTTQLDPVRWHMAEFYWVSSATVGGLQVWLDGSSVYNSGFTSANSNYMAREIRMGGGITSGTGGDPPVAGSAVYYDDVKFSTTGPLGNTVLSLPYNVNLGAQSYVNVAGFDLTNAANANVQFNGGANDTVTGNIVETSNDGGVNVPASLGAPNQALANDGILLTGTGSNSNTITNNIIRRNKARGIHFASAASGATGNTVAYNYIYLNETGGIRADYSQSGDLIENNTLEDNYYGLDLGGATSGFAFQNNLMSRNAALELNAGSSVTFPHSYNLYWRADNTVSTIAYAGSNYETSAVSGFESTAVSGNPRPDVERGLGWTTGSAIGIRGSYVGLNGTIYAGDASSHILSSTNGGNSWNTLYTFTDNSSIQTMFGSIFVDSAGNIYESPNDPNSTTTAQGIYQSTNGGSAWTKVLDLSSYATGTYAWGMSQDTLGNVWGGQYGPGSTSEAYVYKGTSGGASWASSYYDSTGRHIHYVTVDQSTNNIYAVEGDSSSPWYSNKIEESTNNGTNWTQIMPTIPQCFTALATGSFRLLATDSAWPAIYRTTDNTNYSIALDLTMTNLNGPWIERDPVSGTIYASMAVRATPQAVSYIWVSYDNGQTWRTAKLISGGTASDGSNAASNIFQGLMYTNIFPDPGNHNAAVALAINREDDTSLGFWSTAIGKGTGLGLTQDLNGNPVIPGQVTIGAVQYQPKPGLGVM